MLSNCGAKSTTVAPENLKQLSGLHAITYTCVALTMPHVQYLVSMVKYGYLAVVEVHYEFRALYRSGQDQLPMMQNGPLA